MKSEFQDWVKQKYGDDLYGMADDHYKEIKDFLGKFGLDWDEVRDNNLKFNGIVAAGNDGLLEQYSVLGFENELSEVSVPAIAVYDKQSGKTETLYLQHEMLDTFEREQAAKQGVDIKVTDKDLDVFRTKLDSEKASEPSGSEPGMG